MTITIRRARAEEFSALHAIIAEFAQFHGSSDKMVNTVELMHEECDAFTSFVAVTEEHTIIGYAICFFAYFTWSGRSLYLDDLFVKEAYRGQKIGTRLLAAVVDYAAAERCKKVRWQVSRWNVNAQAFYKKFGASIDDVEINCDLALEGRR